MGTTNLQHALKRRYAALTGELTEVRIQIERIHREQAKLPDLEARIPKLEALIESAAMLLKDASKDWEKLMRASSRVITTRESLLP